MANTILSQVAAYTKYFSDTAKSLLPESDLVYLKSAEQGISGLFNFCYSLLNEAKLFHPDFADHGPEHIVQMGNILSDVAKEDFYKANPDVRHLDSLVIIFSACILHDIGMAYLLSDEEYKYEDITRVWSDREFRNLHHRRSMTFIEENVLPYFMVDAHPSNVNKNDNIVNWISFWNTYIRDRNIPWAEPFPKFAMKLVARVCQSHGETDGWLLPDSMHKYDVYRNNNFVKSEDLRDDFGEAWNTVKNKVYGAAVSLCFLDLCNINRFRYIRPSHFIAENIDTTEIARRINFIHYMGHRLERCAWNEDYFNLYIPRESTSEPINLLPLIFDGPGFAFLSWLNHPNFKYAFSTLFNGSYKGTRIKRGPKSETEWYNLTQLLGDENYYSIWPYYEINRQICGDYSDIARYISIPLSFNWLSNSITNGGSGDIEKGAHNPSFHIIECINQFRRSGLAIENCLSPLDHTVWDALKWNSTKPQYIAVKISNPNYQLLDQVGDGYVAAIKTAIKIMESYYQQGNIIYSNKVEFRLSYRGNSIHSALRDATQRHELPENLGSSIILNYISFGEEIRQHIDIIANFKDHGFSDQIPRMLYFGNESIINRLIAECNQDVIMIEYNVNDKMMIIRNNWQPIITEYTGGRNIDIPIDEHVINRIVNHNGSIARLLNLLMQVYDEHQEVVKHISNEISKEQTGEGVHQSLLLLLFEFLENNDKVLQCEVENEFNIISGYLHIEGQIEFKTILESLISKAPHLIRPELINQDVYLIINRKSITEILKTLARDYRVIILLAYIMIFRWKSMRKSFNVGSIIITKDLPLDNCLPDMISLILDENLNFEGRVTLASFINQSLMGPSQMSIVEFEKIKAFIIQMSQNEYIHDDLEKLNDILLFQMTYSFSELAFQSGNLINNIIQFGYESDKAIIQLGILEELVSGKYIYNSEKERNLFDDIISKISKISSKKIQMMAFDILWKYENDKTLSEIQKDTLRNGRECFKTEAEKYNWIKICEYIHTLTIDDAKTVVEKYLYNSDFIEWIKMRSNFQEVLSAMANEFGLIRTKINENIVKKINLAFEKADNKR